MLALICSLWAGGGAAQGYRPQGQGQTDTVWVFGIHPYSNPQDLFQAYEPIAAYLEAHIPGSRFRIEASRDYPDFEAKMAAGAFHFAMPNPYETVLAIAYGYKVIAKMTPDEDFRGLIVARTTKGFRKPVDLYGRTLAFPSQTAVAGTMLPLLYLADHDLDVNRDTRIRYVGSQFSSILNCYTGEAEACGTTVRFWRIWSRDNPDKAAEMEVLWRTPSLPHNGIVARADVNPALARKVAEVLAGMDKDPTLDQSQFKQDQAHFELATNATYDAMTDFLARYDRVIGLPASMKSSAKAK
ncbi:MAG: phosphate/phosphite/phosphonate ABC transporter substrate-binding protein [Actinomycetota bacterium]